MSAMILPVLGLSLLLVPLPTAEAGEMMDLFALIRGRLKYWLRIYKMYEEEVTLGYCWADYFLQFEGSAKNAPSTPSSPSISVNLPNFAPVEIHGFRRRARRDVLAGVISMDSDWGLGHGVQSYGTANFTGDDGNLVKNTGGEVESVGQFARSEDIKSNVGVRSAEDNFGKLIWIDDGKYNSARQSATMEGIWEIFESIVNDGNRWEDKINDKEESFRGNVTENESEKGFFYPKWNSATPVLSEKLKFQNFQRSGLSSPGNRMSFNSGLKVTQSNEGEKDNREPDDFLRARKFARSNLKFQREEQRGFRENYRRNLRRKRDANDRIRSRSDQPPSKGRRASSYNPAFLDRIPIFSSRYRASGNGITKTKISANYFKRYENRLRLDYKKPRNSIILEEDRNISSNLIDASSDSSSLPSSYLPSSDLSKNQRQRRKDNWGRGGSSKQLPTVNDNRRAEVERNTFLREMSVTERAGKKQPILYPVGQPSLLPVSYLRFMGDYGNSTSVTARNSRTSQSSEAENQGRRSSAAEVAARGLRRSSPMIFDLRQMFVGFLRTLGFVVNVGRQLMDYVDSNSALACTKDYLVGKAIHWIDA